MLPIGALIFGLTALGWLYIAHQPSNQGAAAHIKGGPVLGCKDKDDLRRVVGLQGNKAATNNAMAELLNAHKCVMLGDGENVLLEEVKWFAGETAVRRQGETVDYWTIAERVSVK
jgi:hypothetical protein